MWGGRGHTGGPWLGPSVHGEHTHVHVEGHSGTGEGAAKNRGSSRRGVRSGDGRIGAMEGDEPRKQLPGRRQWPGP